MRQAHLCVGGAVGEMGLLGSVGVLVHTRHQAAPTEPNNTISPSSRSSTRTAAVNAVVANKLAVSHTWSAPLDHPADSTPAERRTVPCLLLLSCRDCLFPPFFLQTIIGLKVREVYERITEKEVVPVS